MEWPIEDFIINICYSMRMNTSKSPADRSFIGVGLFIIIAGIAIVGLGGAQQILQLLEQGSFGWPIAKIMGGFTVLSLGYIVLQLELIRQKGK